MSMKNFIVFLLLFIPRAGFAIDWNKISDEPPISAGVNSAEETKKSALAYEQSFKIYPNRTAEILDISRQTGYLPGFVNKHLEEVQRAISWNNAYWAVQNKIEPEFVKLYREPDMLVAGNELKRLKVHDNVMREFYSIKNIYSMGLIFLVAFLVGFLDRKSVV